MPRRPPPAGLYDQVVTTELERRLDPTRSEIDPVEGHDASVGLARLLHHRIRHALSSFPREHAADRQLDLTNRLLELIDADAPGSGADDRVAPPSRKLLLVREPAATALGVAVAPIRPLIPLSSSDLIVNGHHDLSLGPEVRRELASADRVDLLCSFLKWSGLRLLETELKSLLARRPGSVRVLTTAYMSATERRALDALVEMGADVRVSYDTTKTRLHAKAWLFHRESGFSTACIGSSNLSAAAMLDGLEWNVRLSNQDNLAILEKFRATFEQYWSDPEFRVYDAAAFDLAVRTQIDTSSRRFFVVDVLARPHQQEMLDDLAAERLRGRHRNLVVAATGTGKTIVAALDFKRLRTTHPRVLFVAHRREILEQSLDAFRAVLREGSFGELLVGDQRPVRGTEVFASIQSLTEARIAQLEPTAFDVVIVDEFHHAAADSYERLLAHLKPRVLLGLTATPERTDGRSILHFFDGRIASELRLWKALDQGLLSPFQYFGVGVALDLTGARLWSAGHYDRDALSNVYTANDVVLLRVLQELQRRVRDVHSMRALGFCVDVAHAEFMAKRFTERGLPSLVVSAGTSQRHRDEALAAFRRGEVRVLFSVDLLNEGVDLPDVDTVLFLRPTESATVFLQQLGRGLRRSEKKDCLTVLDFIGHANAKFRFDQRYRAIVGGTRRDVLRAVETQFPSLPSGCVIELDRQSQDYVLENIKQSLQLGRKAMLEDLQKLGPEVSLPVFLERAGLELEDLYGNDWSFSRLRRLAGFEQGEPSKETESVERAIARMLHLDDAPRLEGLRALLTQRRPPRADPSSLMQRWLFVSLGFAGQPLSQMPGAWNVVWNSPGLRSELLSVIDLLADRSRWLEGQGDRTPLRLHATYSRDEAIAAFDERDNKGALKRPREGVFFSERHNVDLLFVTLEKSADDYSPTTMYDDYPLTPRRFHWQSQSRDHESTANGRRYLAAGANGHEIVLLVRQRQRDRRRETMPYVNLGPVRYLRHEGNRPMSIEWALQNEMPMWFFQETKRAAS